jgi:GT2 family glycosyltransferase
VAAPEASRAPEVTIAIVTRDRKDELRRAIVSSLEQEGSIEVLVVDDGSRDGTAEMVRDEFPEVRVVRYEDDADVAVRRNDAAALARGEVIVSIDDDAVFTSPQIVADTLADFDHARIAAVAIPYIDVGVNPEVQQRAREPTERWVTPVFRATAYAIRRDVLLQVGGYSPEIYQHGEEWDLSLKLLNAGYVIRLGRSDPIHHHLSPKRSFRRWDVFARRHEMLISWLYFPFPWYVAYMVVYAVKGLALGFRVGRPWNMVVGVAAGLRACVAERHNRRPISRSAFRFDQRNRARARANVGVPLSEAEARLGPVGPPPKPPAGGWPGFTRALYAPLRQARTRLVRTVGRPVRCERCGAELFRGVALLWRGRVILLGAEGAHVRVDWDRMNRLSFRHVDQDHCRPR